MRSILSRAAALVAVLVVAAPAAAGAAVPEYAAEASTSSVRIAAFPDAVGSDLLDLVSTDAFAASDPIASANVGVIEVLGEQVFSPAEATSDGEPVRDPEEGDGCVLPVDAPGLTLDAVCAVASADAGPSDEATANATTDLLEVGVNGSLVSAVLTDPLGDLLTELGDDLADGLVTDVITELTAECDTFLAGLGSEVPDTVGGLIDMLPEGTEELTQEAQDVIAAIGDGNACTAIIALTLEDILAPAVDLQPLANALQGVELIDLRVDGAVSDIAGDDASLDATATQAFVGITGPSLSFVDDVLTGIVEGIFNGIVAQIEEATGQDYPGPTEADLQAVLDQIPLFGIDDPLLEASISGGVATATLDNGAGTTTSGGERPYVELTIAPGVLELLGQDPEQATIRLEAGQTQTIAEGTPLESTISVGDLQTEDGAEFEGLTGSTATASATTVSLLNVPDAGSVEIALAESNAGVYAASVTAGSAPPPPSEPLPHTGGGAAVAAVLALGAGLALLRRRD